jgi:hypothetical protein
MTQGTGGILFAFLKFCRLCRHENISHFTCITENHERELELAVKINADLASRVEERPISFFKSTQMGICLMLALHCLFKTNVNDIEWD